MMFVLLIGLIVRLGKVAETSVCRPCSVCKGYLGYQVKRQLQRYLLIAWQPYDLAGFVACSYLSEHLCLNMVFQDMICSGFLTRILCLSLYAYQCMPVVLYLINFGLDIIRPGFLHPGTA